jgi:hypothetical protein
VLRFFDISGKELLVVPADILDPVIAPTRGRSVTAGDAHVKPKSKTATSDIRKDSVTEKKKFSFSFNKKGRSASVSERPSLETITGEREGEQKLGEKNI